MCAAKDIRKPDAADILEAIQTSGYLFENEVGLRFERAGFQVDYDYSYEDRDEGKFSGIDILASDAERVLGPEDSEGLLTMSVVTTCRDTTKPVVFFTRKTSKVGKPTTLSLASVGAAFEWPSYEGRERNPDAVQSRAFDFFMESDHRLTTPTISSQFCIIQPNSGKRSKAWEATKGAFYNDLAIPLIKAAHYRKQLVSHVIDPLDSEVVYPLFVLRDDLYACDVSAGRQTVKQVEHVVLHTEYISRNVRGYFVLDVITRSYLDQYLAIVRSEMEKLHKFLGQNLLEVQRYVEGKRAEESASV